MTAPILKFDTLLLPGTRRAAGHARRWLESALGAHPSLRDAALCMSELVTNAVLYTASGRDGQVQVEASYSNRSIRIKVIDEGEAESVPHLATADEGASSGRGLRIVSYMATSWGVEQHGKGHAVWFELRR